MLSNQANSLEQSNWVKRPGTANYDVGFLRQRKFCSLVYVNTSGVRQELSIHSYTNENPLRLIYSDKIYYHYIYYACLKEGLAVQENFIGSIIYDTNNNDDIRKFLKVIDQVSPLGLSVKKEIFASINAPKEFFASLNAPKGSYSKLKSLIQAGQLNETILKAKAMYDKHVLWDLGQYCEQSCLYNEAISIYQEIDKNNLHYYEANYQAAHIIMSYLCIDSELSAEDKEQYNIASFRFMLRANYECKNQQWLDQMYHELSGGNDLNPTVQNINADDETLIKLAEQTKNLRNQNKALKEKIARLEEKILQQIPRKNSLSFFKEKDSELAISENNDCAFQKLSRSGN